MRCTNQVLQGHGMHTAQTSARAMVFMELQAARSALSAIRAGVVCWVWLVCSKQIPLAGAYVTILKLAQVPPGTAAPGRPVTAAGLQDS